MDHVTTIRMLMIVDPLRRAALEAVAALDVPDCWIGAGFVRDAVWDHLHSYGVIEPKGDVDVVWHDAASPAFTFEESVEQRLRDKMPDLQWSVKNQARMHICNGNAPYASVSAANTAIKSSQSNKIGIAQHQILPLAFSGCLR